MEWQKTACILCECNCGLEVQVDGRRLVRFRGDKAHPASRGYACEKPHQLDFYQNSADRITQPLRRRPDGTFEEIDWDTAIREVAQRLARVRDEHGGESIFYYGGGGQGNHLPGAYATATRRVLGSRYRSSALAQEKTGEFWVTSRMLGAFTRSDFDNCDVAVFIGKNPWHSHGFPRARVTLKEIAKDPKRTMIVIDPRRSETAAMADIHLQVRPGRDAWLVAAMAAVLVQEDLLDHKFLAEHTDGLEAVVRIASSIPVAAYCDYAGVPEQQARAAARAIGAADSVASCEDLGVQMNRHSTLVSYLHRWLWLLTGNFGKPGTQYVPTSLVAIAENKRQRTSPVAGARIVSGMVPCNVIAEEILTDHPKRYRAMLVEASNPVHSLADSKRMREALGALDTVVVIDVAMTETARCADYVLPASTQYEKAEATFFNFEFPRNYFQVRAPLLAPPSGPLPEAEIHARLCEALGAVTADDLEPLAAAAREGAAAYANAFVSRVLTAPRLRALAPVLLYRTLGPMLPAGLQESAVLWGLAAQAALTNAPSLAGAGFDGTPQESAQKLFDALISNPSGVVFSEDTWDVCFDRVGTIHLALDDLLEEAESLAAMPDDADAEFPFLLAAGERRSFTANTIVRDPGWRKKDGDGALRLSPGDAKMLKVTTGDAVRLTTARDTVVVTVAITDTMRAGHVSLPNGLGVDFRAGQGDTPRTGVALNELTSAAHRDRFVGTPWHKTVPAKLERL